jgi:hydrogenase nickel incorporation protein HypA/HybF
VHERSLVKDLVRRVEQAAAGARVTVVRVRLGKLCHLSPEHLRGHFAHVAAGSPVAGAELVIEMGTDVADPFAANMVVESIDVAVGAAKA